jgi:hypothetical protein
MKKAGCQNGSQPAKPTLIYGETSRKNAELVVAEFV